MKPDVKPDDVVHILSQEGQPYGSTRRCCNHCGVMIGMSTLPRYVDNWADWRNHHSSCGNYGRTAG